MFWTKSRKPSCTMSTDRKKRNVPHIVNTKILEYGAIGLVILLFLGLAILYGLKKPKQGADEADAASTPVPTADSSIRGKNVLDAIEDSSFSLTYRQDHYDLTSANGSAMELRMQSDDRGLRELSVVTLLCPDPEGDSEIERLLRSENTKTTEALRELFDRIMPVLRRTAADSDIIVKQCSKVVKTGEVYSKHMGQFTVRIQSDPEAIPQSVTITFIRDSK